MICSECGGQINGKWGETGPNPSTKIYVRNCGSCGEVYSDRFLIEQIIDDNRKCLEFNKEVNHSWPDSLDMIISILGLGGSRLENRVRNELISQDLW